MLQGGGAQCPEQAVRLARTMHERLCRNRGFPGDRTIVRRTVMNHAGSQAVERPSANEDNMSGPARPDRISNAHSMLTMAVLLTRPTPTRRDAPLHGRGRSERRAEACSGYPLRIPMQRVQPVKGLSDALTFQAATRLAHKFDVLRNALYARPEGCGVGPAVIASGDCG